MPFTCDYSEILAALAQAERGVRATGAALLEGLPDSVHAATQELHDSAHALALALRGVDRGDALVQPLRARLVRVAQDIAMQREALLRRSAMVERSLHSLVPQTRASTYSGALGRFARGAGRSAGFRTF